MKKTSKLFKMAASLMAAAVAINCAGVGAYAYKLKTVDNIKYVYSDNDERLRTYTGWTHTSKGRRYYKNGVMYTNKWLKTKKGYYYAGKDGYMRTGWALVTRGEGSMSFFDENGLWDGQTYWTGYKPATLRQYFLDRELSTEYEYRSRIYPSTKFKTFSGIETVIEILEKDLDTPLVYDEINDDEIDVNYAIYHGGQEIGIGQKDMPELFFTKDKEGNSYVYNRYYGFGCKLSDCDAYDKIFELLE